MATIVVQYGHDPPITDEVFEQMTARLKPCLEVRAVIWQATYLSADRRNQMCVFEAPDAETVRDAYRTADVTAVVRVWKATAWTVNDPTT